MGRGHPRWPVGPGALGCAVGLCLAGAVGCSLALDPDRLDDVPRCRYDSDCPIPDDPRFELVCTVADGYDDPGFPRICSPAPSFDCDPLSFPTGSTFRQRFQQAMVAEDLYRTNCGELAHDGGVAGCPPTIDGCAPGLVVHPGSGRCDDDDPNTPPALAPEPLVAGQDVLDQFCRAVYCDNRFVCNAKAKTCMRCEEGRALGRGGCGDLYFDGQRSSVYQSDEDLAQSCAGPDFDETEIPFGPVAVSPEDGP